MTPELIATCPARHVRRSRTTAAASTSRRRCRLCSSFDMGTVSLPLLMHDSRAAAQQPQLAARSEGPCMPPCSERNHHQVLWLVMLSALTCVSWVMQQ